MKALVGKFLVSQHTGFADGLIYKATNNAVYYVTDAERVYRVPKHHISTNRDTSYHYRLVDALDMALSLNQSYTPEVVDKLKKKYIED